jgi:hypothetical protein
MGKYPKEKVPELYAAKRALIAYLKDHNIDPSDTKRIQTDPELKKLVYKLNKERDKVMANYPALDKSNNIKLLKMAKEDKKAKKAKKKVKEAEAPKTEKKKQGRVATKYDYPQVKDEKTGKMRDMTSAEKKKYRMEQRKAANGGTTSKKKEKAPKEAPVKDKKKASKDEKSKKAKKVKKEED